MKRTVILTIFLLLGLLMHGIFSSKDYNPMPSLAKALAQAGIASMWCSEQYLATYGDRATLVKIDGENHLITRRKKEILARTVDFFREVLD